MRKNIWFLALFLFSLAYAAVPLSSSGSFSLYYPSCSYNFLKVSGNYELQCTMKYSTTGISLTGNAEDINNNDYVCPGSLTAACSGSVSLYNLESFLPTLPPSGSTPTCTPSMSSKGSVCPSISTSTYNSYYMTYYSSSSVGSSFYMPADLYVYVSSSSPSCTNYKSPSGALLKEVVISVKKNGQTYSTVVSELGGCAQGTATFGIGNGNNGETIQLTDHKFQVNGLLINGEDSYGNYFYHSSTQCGSYSQFSKSASSASTLTFRVVDQRNVYGPNGDVTVWAEPSPITFDSNKQAAVSIKGRITDAYVPVIVNVSVITPNIQVISVENNNQIWSPDNNHVINFHVDYVIAYTGSSPPSEVKFKVDIKTVREVCTGYPATYSTVVTVPVTPPSNPVATCILNINYWNNGQAGPSANPSSLAEDQQYVIWAQCKDSNGNLVGQDGNCNGYLSGNGFSWSVTPSFNPFDISCVNNRCRGIYPRTCPLSGSATATATTTDSRQIQCSTNLQVTGCASHTLTCSVSPQTANIYVGQTQQFTRTCLYDGASVDCSGTWSLSNPSDFSIVSQNSQQAVVLANDDGTTSVIYSGSYAGLTTQCSATSLTATYNINPSCTISPNPATIIIPPGSTTLTATCFNYSTQVPCSSIIEGDYFQWSVQSGSASVSRQGSWPYASALLSASSPTSGNVRAVARDLNNNQFQCTASYSAAYQTAPYYCTITLSPPVIYSGSQNNNATVRCFNSTSNQQVSCQNVVTNSFSWTRNPTSAFSYWGVSGALNQNATFGIYPTFTGGPVVISASAPTNFGYNLNCSVQFMVQQQTTDFACRIIPQVVNLPQGSSQNFSIECYNSTTGSPISCTSADSPFAWSYNPSVFSSFVVSGPYNINAATTVSPTAPLGATTIGASTTFQSIPVQCTASLATVVPPLTTDFACRVLPPSVDLPQGGSQIFNVQCYNATTGSLISCGGADRPFSWTYSSAVFSSFVVSGTMNTTANTTISLTAPLGTTTIGASTTFQGISVICTASISTVVPPLDSGLGCRILPPEANIPPGESGNFNIQCFNSTTGGIVSCSIVDRPFSWTYNPSILSLVVSGLVNDSAVASVLATVPIGTSTNLGASTTYQGIPLVCEAAIVNAINISDFRCAIQPPEINMLPGSTQEFTILCYDTVQSNPVDCGFADSPFDWDYNSALMSLLTSGPMNEEAQATIFPSVPLGTSTQITASTTYNGEQIMCEAAVLTIGNISDFECEINPSRRNIAPGSSGLFTIECFDGATGNAVSCSAADVPFTWTYDPSSLSLTISGIYNINAEAYVFPSVPNNTALDLGAYTYFEGELVECAAAIINATSGGGGDDDKYSCAIQPSSVNTNPGSTTSFVAVCYEDGRLRDCDLVLRPSSLFSWSLSDPLNFDITGTGGVKNEYANVTANPGIRGVSTSIMASAEARNGHDLTCTAATLNIPENASFYSCYIIPGMVNVLRGAQVTFEIRCRDPDGAPVSCRSIVLNGDDSDPDNDNPFDWTHNSQQSVTLSPYGPINLFAHLYVPLALHEEWFSITATNKDIDNNDLFCNAAVHILNQSIEDCIIYL
ncbi:MAG: Ig-like domain-containing protein [Candidatus Anstonellales archaeon]